MSQTSDIYKDIFNNNVNNYINKIDNVNNILYTDTTLISNKLDSNMIT